MVRVAAAASSPAPARPPDAMGDRGTSSPARQIWQSVAVRFQADSARSQRSRRDRGDAAPLIAASMFFI